MEELVGIDPVTGPSQESSKGHLLGLDNFRSGCIELCHEAKDGGEVDDVDQGPASGGPPGYRFLEFLESFSPGKRVSLRESCT